MKSISSLIARIVLLASGWLVLSGVAHSRIRSSTVFETGVCLMTARIHIVHSFLVPMETITV